MSFVKLAERMKDTVFAEEIPAVLCHTHSVGRK